MSETLSRIFESALVALLIPGVWIKGAIAQDENKRLVDITGPTACRYCLMGAVQAAARTLHPTLSRLDHHLLERQLRIRLHRHIRDMVGYGPSVESPETFNDTRGHAWVIELLERTVDENRNA